MTTGRRRLWLVLLLAVVLVGVPLAYAVKAGTDRPETHDDGWQWLHGKAYVEDSTVCDSCHEELDCFTCHLARYPHPDAWLDVHGAEALRLNGRGCSFCHRSSFCDPCHGGLQMPHDTEFLVEHAKGTLSSDSCTQCHVTSDCQACHLEHGAHRSGGLVLP